MLILHDDLICRIAELTEFPFNLRMVCTTFARAIGPTQTPLTAVVSSRAVIEVALVLGLPWDKCLPEHAALAGKLDVLKWLYARNFPRRVSPALYAARAGHIHIIEWVHEKFSANMGAVGYAAAKYGQWNVLEWLAYKYPRLAKQTRFSAMAARHGQSHIIRNMMRSDKFIWNTLYVAEEAAEGGHQEILELLWGAGVRMNHTSLTRSAARGDNLSVLQWLRAIGCP